MVFAEAFSFDNMPFIQETNNKKNNRTALIYRIRPLKGSHQLMKKLKKRDETIRKTLFIN